MDEPNDEIMTVDPSLIVRGRSDEIAGLREERETLIREVSRLSRELGEAQGRLMASEMVGVVQGWKDRAERAEAEVAEMKQQLTPIIPKADSGSSPVRKWRVRYIYSGKAHIAGMFDSQEAADCARHDLNQDEHVSSVWIECVDVEDANV